MVKRQIMENFSGFFILKSRLTAQKKVCSIYTNFFSSPQKPLTDEWLMRLWAVAVAQNEI